MKIKAYLAAMAAVAGVGAVLARQQAAPPAPPAAAPPAQQAQPAQQSAQQQAQPPSASQAEARDILMRMANYLSTLPAFSVSVASNYDVLQPSGQKIEYGEVRKLVVQRPDHLRSDTERSDGERSTAVFTGADMALLDVSNKLYASTPQPGGLDESILYFVSDLKMRFPMAMLLMARLPSELERRVRSVDYVETSHLFGSPTHHLAARGDTADFQVWVREGDHPLPMRVVITYKDEPGQPEYRADFSNWNVRPSITAKTFHPTVPGGTQKVAFAAQLMGLGTPGHGPK